MPDPRPPTRVSVACDRCRRNKQRCDTAEPCGKCIQAAVPCTKSDLPPPHKKARTLSRAQSHEANATAVRSCASPLTSGPSLNRQLSEFDLQPPRDASFAQAFHRQSASGAINDHQDRSSRYSPIAVEQGRSPVRAEKSVLADLGGSESAVDITKKILGYGTSPLATDRATFAIPGGGPNRSLSSISTSRTLLPVSQIVGVDLPERTLCDALIDAYFYSVHWFSLVVYEPKFRQTYSRVVENGFAEPSDRPFLLLLLMVLVMGCWYGPGLGHDGIAPATELADLRNTYLRVIRSSLMDLMDDDCLEFVQLCILLGSYWLYWGRPKSSFSILGAATKSSQAIGLHRDPDKRVSLADAEERKRIWWTIYTWDRFATIIYGRPLGINDKDCNVAMPTSFPEDINFTLPDEKTPVSLSPYQIQLNRVYQIASPLLENIYGIRFSTDPSLRSEMPAMITRIDQMMRDWQEKLPVDLNLEKKGDIGLTTPIEAKLHRLQALALQLTYDNLMIVIHRPLLADQRHKRSTGGNQNAIHAQSSTLNTSTHRNSFQQCLNSALRISRIQQCNRNLLALARRTHLVSFIGMNLFTSSVVMFICALSDTLSDLAQEAKRGITRNLKMLKLLSGDGSLSMQCSKILEDLVQIIVDKEKEEMLRSHPTEDEVALFVPTRRSSAVEGHGVNFGNQDVAAMSWATTHPQQKEVTGTDETAPSGGFQLQRTIASLQKGISLHFCQGLY
ncbi:hypothetical protein LTR84_009466 [Exophiala bonariae]|uniref:Zn(2)-C6 fungal-type domain-containing protein n=1 Tax=Exophiala bonariae TaxID=1690606 RepID=A0AAV9MXR2_9EURO|nr:hypothetical protein LTR84_009466 [Exophiala bonariae]